MSDQDRVRRLAAERNYRNRHDPRHQGVLNDPKRIDEEGARGELAFAEMFAISTDQVQAKERVAYNFILADKTRVDVRSSGARYARLIVPPAVAQRTSIDVFVLCQITKDGAELMGWATREEVLKAPVQTISPRPGATLLHVMITNDLQAMDLLLARHQMRTRPLPFWPDHNE